MYPNRVDVFPGLEGVGFDEAWEARQPGKYYDVDVYFLSVGHLITAKRASGRAQDLVDVQNLIRADIARQKGKF